jgi:hypothetical protein
MNINKIVDIGFSEEGDLEIVDITDGADIDMIKKQGIEGIKQAIRIRLKTELTGCALWPEMGQDLKSSYGRRMTKKNVAKVKNLLIKALTFGNLFDIIKVEVAPIQDSILVLAATIQMGVACYSFTCDFDFRDSLLSEVQFDII